jgi:hypothetical protein
LLARTMKSAGAPKTLLSALAACNNFPRAAAPKRFTKRGRFLSTWERRGTPGRPKNAFLLLLILNRPMLCCAAALQPPLFSFVIIFFSETPTAGCVQQPQRCTCSAIAAEGKMQQARCVPSPPSPRAAQRVINLRSCKIAPS